MPTDHHNTTHSTQSDHNCQSNDGCLTVDRRTFLRLAGFTFAGAVVAGCQPAKVEKAIPFLIEPEEVTPGVSKWYATTCGGCSAGCGVMAKVRDGRPIKLEGNRDHPLSKGGLCAVGQASLLSLYDSQRLKSPIADGRENTWEEIDRSIREQLGSIKRSNGAVRILTGTITSPTTKDMIQRFLSGFKDARHVVYDPLSSSAILDAHKQTHGVRVLPQYHFDLAQTIVSFDADFLGTWISPVQFSAAYRSGRSLEGASSRFSYHVQVESRLSLTGSNADRRVRLAPSEIRSMIRELALHLASMGGERLPGTAAGVTDSHIQEIAERLWKSPGRSLVICGLNDLDAQTSINFINNALGNYGSTVDIDRSSHQRQGSDAELLSLMQELKSGSIAALFVRGVNPAYDLPDGEAIGEKFKKVPLVVSFAERVDETASAARFVCPEPHALESWDDAEVVAGMVSVSQPVIQPFGKTRTFAESLSAWMGKPQSAYDLIRRRWERTIFRKQRAHKDFQSYWDEVVSNGWAQVSVPPQKKVAFNASSVPTQRQAGTPGNLEGKLTLVLHPTISMLDGRHAHNPWLHELPDPVTKIVWDNYASVSPDTAARLDLNEHDIVRIQAIGKSVELPVQIQPGQHDGVVAVAVGYGRMGTERFTNIGPRWLEARPTVPPGGLVGKNVAPFLTSDSGFFEYDALYVTLTKTGGWHMLASTQDYHSVKVPEHLAAHRDEMRPIVQETSYASYVTDPTSGSFPKRELVSMWPEEHTYPGHHWGMVIDLSACTGCSACVIACVAENNIPVVGKDEVSRNRELTWIRIDRYYTEEGGDVKVAHQPMMCQQCGHAPCETVCPVLATVHSEEGLNQQIYNRCVGTRYCSNNCPFKVRRFNWFNYSHGDDMQRLVLNPDVTVRERGVMEKCTFCVQRIQEAKIEAKRNGVALKDGDIKPACQQSCPANAIAFGDMNDPDSRVSRLMKDPRCYRVLEEIGVRPSVGYLTLVRNRDEGEKANG